MIIQSKRNCRYIRPRRTASSRVAAAKRGSLTARPCCIAVDTSRRSLEDSEDKLMDQEA